MENTSTTELEAVNTLLACIGESPVNSLTVSSTSDVALAKRVLSEVNRKVQSDGWDFNVEKEVELAKDNTGLVTFPLNTLRAYVDKTRYSDIDPVVRGNRLYDRKNRTYVFDRNIVCTLITLLDFTDLPQTAREYITIRAARIFVDRAVGDNSLRSYTLQEEGDAKRALARDQAIKRELNTLNCSTAREVLLWRQNAQG